MPKRVYSHDRAGTYIFRILNGPDDYDSSEITTDVLETAKDIEREINWRSRHLGGFSEGRFTDVIEEVLKLYSPADQAPPFIEFGPVCEWLNQASPKEIENMVVLAPNVAVRVLDSRPIRNRRHLYSILLKLYQDPQNAMSVYRKLMEESSAWLGNRNRNS